jgi:hypothetical protein
MRDISRYRVEEVKKMAGSSFGKKGHFASQQGKTLINEKN